MISEEDPIPPGLLRSDRCINESCHISTRFPVRKHESKLQGNHHRFSVDWCDADRTRTKIRVSHNDPPPAHNEASLCQVDVFWSRWAEPLALGRGWS